METRVSCEDVVGGVTSIERHRVGLHWIGFDCIGFDLDLDYASAGGRELDRQTRLGQRTIDVKHMEGRSKRRIGIGGAGGEKRDR